MAINETNLEWFVLNNASNNNIALVELSKLIGFDSVKNCLKNAGHMINLAAETFLFGNHLADLDKCIWDEQSETEKLTL